MKTNTHRILAYLQKVKESTPTEISVKTKVHYQVVKLLLNSLKDKGLVNKRTNENETIEYWRIAK